MRDAALRLSQLDMSDPEAPPPSEEHVTQWVKNITYELGKARERGQHVPPGVAVYADPRMLEAANRIATQSLRLRLEDGTELYLAPPPPSYTLGTLEQEIERAAAEAQPTQKLSAERLPEVKEIPGQHKGFSYETECRWCGRSYEAHAESHAPGAPVPRMPCTGLRSHFLARADASQATGEQL